MSPIPRLTAPTYCPPSFDVLAHFADTVCQEFGPEFADPEIARGLASFMDTVARICANNLNRKSDAEFDHRVD